MTGRTTVCPGLLPHSHSSIRSSRSVPSCLPARPTAAVHSSTRGAQVWFTDCDDPLGILGHDTLRTRPAHHKIPPERPEGLPAVFWQWIFVVEAADTYVVDRASGTVWRAADPPPTHDGHPILPLLVLFLDAIGGARAAAGVAVTAFRTFHAIA